MEVGGRNISLKSSKILLQLARTGKMLFGAVKIRNSRSLEINGLYEVAGYWEKGGNGAIKQREVGKSARIGQITI